MVDATLPVLVIDDVATMRQVLCRLLTQIGFTDVEAVGDGRAALERLTEKKFRLVISDWHMQPMSGIGLLHLMRGREDLKRIPVIFISAEANAKNLLAAKEAGARGYLVKPFSAEALKIKIDDIFGRPEI
jgi:two-component system chemotaxis response regulator CheY